MERIYHGRRVDLYKVDARELVVHPGAVVILPLVDPQTVILIRNRRFAVEKTLWELPAGTLEKDEPPLVCAKRELEEETGYMAESWRSLPPFYTSPGFCNEILHPYIASDLTAGTQQLDAQEEIEVERVPFEKALEMCRSGDICDAKTLALLLHYAAFCLR